MILMKIITITSVIKIMSFFMIFFIMLKIKFQQNLNVNDVRTFTV